MASYVPDFELDRSSPRGENRNAIRGDEELMELLWQNGQVGTQTQNQRSLKKLTNAGGGGGDGGGGFAEIPFLQPSSTTHAREISSSVVDGETGSRQRHQPQHQQLFIQEDEMASWLQYPLDDLDREIYSDILYSPPTSPPHRETRSGVTTEELLRPQIPPAPSTASIAPRPPIGPPQSQSQFPLAPSTSSVAAARPPTIYSTDVEEIAAAAAPPPPNFQNFLNFSRVSKGIKIESVPSSSMKTPRELTSVDSNETFTATAGQESRFTPAAAGSSAQLSGRNVGTSAASTSTAGKDFATTCDLTVTASPGGSATSVSASVEATPQEHKPTLSTAEEERKRKEREPDDNDCQSDDDDFGSGEVKKQSHKCTSVKRSRAAEVHNLSERRRRDRINEKMKALQELIPRCNKVDKASMLDEAIEYLKSLQLQVQMMSMGCGMVPMMYPGAQQQYMAAMGMSMGMMGMGMDIGAMNQPMMPYPTQFPASGFPFQAAAANLAPRFPMPPFPLQPVPVPITARPPASIKLYPGVNSLPVQGSNQPRLSTPLDSYQHLTAFQQAQVPINSYVQNQVVVQPRTNNSSNRGEMLRTHPENQKTG